MPVFWRMLRTVARASGMARAPRAQVIGHERDVGRVDGHVGAGSTHGHADIGGGERRRR